MRLWSDIHALIPAVDSRLGLHTECRLYHADQDRIVEGRLLSRRTWDGSN